MKIALICFDTTHHTHCDVFSGTNHSTTFSTTYWHPYGGLGYYNGQPTTVGSNILNGYRKVETLGPLGWTDLTDHPR